MTNRNEPPAHWFQRIDEDPDEVFYASPRFVEHIDKATIENLSKYYAEIIDEKTNVLDLMSSWVSHLPSELELTRSSGLGMNEQELRANNQLSDWCVHNLNTKPQLPYPVGTFDYVLCAVSIQYLTAPIEVLKSALEVLRKRGRIVIAMSHRLFPTKAVSIFQHTTPQDRIKLVSSYLEIAGFDEVTALDRSPTNADPLWIITGQKLPKKLY